jgi:hypothetical protein
MTKEFIGQIGLDTSTIFIVDPCYINDPSRWNPQKLLDGSKRELTLGNIPMSDNLKRLAKEKTQIQNLVNNWDKYCEDQSKADNKPRKYAAGLLIPTGADGGYNVYLHKDKHGEPTKIEIQL